MKTILLLALTSLSCMAMDEPNTLKKTKNSSNLKQLFMDECTPKEKEELFSDADVSFEEKELQEEKD